MSISVKITGSSYFLPGKPIPFNELDNFLGNFNAAPLKIQRWIERIKPVMGELIGIESYHLAIDPDTKAFTDDNISMSVKAAQKAITDADISAADIDFIAYGSAHQDQMPTASVHIQEKLGIARCAEISVHANCTSAYKALLIAYDFIKSGRYKKALVVSSNMASSELRSSYYNMSLIKKEDIFLRYFLSDGAAALILEADTTNHKKGLYVEQCFIESLGGYKPSAMGNKRPAYYVNPKEEFDNGWHHLSQMFNDNLRDLFIEEDGSVFKKGLQRMLSLYPTNLKEIKYFQVNFPSKHISDMIMEECENMGISQDKLYTKISSMGYIGPPMAFVCLDRIRKEEDLCKNDIILSFVTEVSKFMQAGFICKMY